jgi:hypothetical protein
MVYSYARSNTMVCYYIIRDLVILLINYTFFLIRTALTVLLAIGITGIRKRLWLTSTTGDIDTKKPVNITSQLG